MNTFNEKEIAAMIVDMKKETKKQRPTNKNLLIKIGKMSKFYEYVKVSKNEYECGYVVDRLDNGVEKNLSIKMYIQRCYLYRRFKNMSKVDNDVIIKMYVTKISKAKKVKLWTLDDNYQFFIDKYTICKVTKVSANVVDAVLEKDPYDSGVKILIEFFGLNAEKQKKKLMSYYKKICELDIKNQIGGAYIYSLKGVSYVTLKTFDQIFMENDKKNKIIQSIDNMTKRSMIQVKYGLNPKFGILLYGKPGTGKTSVIKAIINNIYSNPKLFGTSYITRTIDVSTSLGDFREDLKVSKENINSVGNGSNSLFIYIIEEIDAIMNETRDKDMGDVNAKIKLLLEFIDGFSTPNGSAALFLASTNYYERLDQALRRDGRFDLKIELGDLGKEESKEMLKHFGLSEDIKIFDGGKSWNGVDEDFKINPAELQNIILGYLANREEE